jgi:putative ABC transport system substrate-binding protein
LSDLGYVEGQNLAIEWRWGRGSTERFPEFATEVVKLGVDVIVAGNDAAGRAAQRATKTIPIVIAIIGDPMGGGFATSLAKPGGNVTGLTFGGSLASKRLQIFKEALPRLSRVGLLVDVSNLSNDSARQEAETAAQTLGIRLAPRVDVSRPEALAGAFATMTKERATAVLVLGGTMFFVNRTRLGELAMTHHLPTMCGVQPYVSAGCLMGYAADIAEMFRRSAVYVDKILKGAKPADLPIEQPTKFQLVINLKAAKSLGVTIASSVLAQADQVIE